MTKVGKMLLTTVGVVFVTSTLADSGYEYASGYGYASGSGYPGAWRRENCMSGWCSSVMDCVSSPELCGGCSMCSDHCYGDADCCTPENPCGVGDGNCASDSDCEGDLICGKDNCLWADPVWRHLTDDGGDCCMIDPKKSTQCEDRCLKDCLGCDAFCLFDPEDCGGCDHCEKYTKYESGSPKSTERQAETRKFLADIAAASRQRSTEQTTLAKSACEDWCDEEIYCGWYPDSCGGCDVCGTEEEPGKAPIPTSSERTDCAAHSDCPADEHCSNMLEAFGGVLTCTANVLCTRDYSVDGACPSYVMEFIPGMNATMRMDANGEFNADLCDLRKTEAKCREAHAVCTWKNGSCTHRSAKVLECASTDESKAKALKCLFEKDPMKSCECAEGAVGPMDDCGPEEVKWFEEYIETCKEEAVLKTGSATGSTGLAAGAIAGIVIGVLIGLSCLGFGGYLLWTKVKTN